VRGGEGRAGSARAPSRERERERDKNGRREVACSSLGRRCARRKERKTEPGRLVDSRGEGTTGRVEPINALAATPSRAKLSHAAPRDGDKRRKRSGDKRRDSRAGERARVRDRCEDRSLVEFQSGQAARKRRARERERENEPRTFSLFRPTVRPPDPQLRPSLAVTTTTTTTTTTLAPKPPPHHHHRHHRRRRRRHHQHRQSSAALS
jgi:hypothetical protein